MSKKNRIIAENSLLIRPSLCITSFNSCLLKGTICFVSTLGRCPSQQDLFPEQLYHLSVSLFCFPETVAGIQAREVHHSTVWYFSLCRSPFSQSYVLSIVDPGELSFCETSTVWALKPVAAIPGDSEFYFWQRHLHLVCFIAPGWLKLPNWATARVRYG